MSKKRLSVVQKKIINKLENGEVCSRTRMGPYTGSFKFAHEKGISSATIDKLRLFKVIEVTSKMTMYGLTEYCHLPEMRPWAKDPSFVQFMNRH